MLDRTLGLVNNPLDILHAFAQGIRCQGRPVSRAQGLAKVPPNAQEGELGFELTPLERTIGVHSDKSAPYLTY